MHKCTTAQKYTHFIERCQGKVAVDCCRRTGKILAAKRLFMIQS